MELRMLSYLKHIIPVGSKEFLTHLHANARVVGSNHCIADRNCGLSGDCLNHTGKVVLLCRTQFDPRDEPSQLTVVSIVCHIQLGADEQDFLVQNDDPAVVPHILVHDWPRAIEGLKWAGQCPGLEVRKE